MIHEFLPPVVGAVGYYSSEIKTKTFTDLQNFLLLIHEVEVGLFNYLYTYCL